MAEATVRCCLAVAPELVLDTAQLEDLIALALDQLVEHAGDLGWRLEGEPTAVILQPVHAAALGLHVESPEGSGEHLVVVISVDAVDELDALLAR